MLDLDIKSTIDEHIDVWDEGGALQQHPNPHRQGTRQRQADGEEQGRHDEGKSVHRRLDARLRRHARNTF